MTLEEKKNLLIKMGVPKQSAEYYLEDESDIWAVVPAFRLLKPLNDNLEFYRDHYKEVIEARMKDDTLDKTMPEVAQLIEAGASPEIIANFAYTLILQAYNRFLYQLDDHEGAEVSDVFCDEDFSKCGYARLMEQGPNGEATGRYLIEVHGKIPFSDLY